MAGVYKIVHNNQEILFVDYKGCTVEKEMIDILHQAQNIVQADNRAYLQLVDVSGVYATPGFMSEAKRVAYETPKLAKKRAIVGVDSPGRRVLLHIYNLMLGANKVIPFDTLDKAKSWLTRQESSPRAKIKNYKTDKQKDHHPGKA